MAIDWEAKCGAPLNAVFGEAALYIPRDDSPPYPVNIVFDEAYREVIMLDMDSLNTDARPVCGINDGQGLGHQQWDQDDRVKVTRNGVTYLVKESRPDGHGITKLMLAKTQPYTP